MSSDVTEGGAPDLSAFSICIPTFNRVDLLGLCLEHLLTFRGTNFELIIGDNASTDGTHALVDGFASRFEFLTYLRHKENIGFARNMDSLLRRATRPYVYILSDDDFVYEDALVTVHRIFGARADIVAVIGKYSSHTTLDSSLRVDHSDAVGTIFKKGNHQALLDNFVICDGHPFIRREVFQRHCAYWDRSIGLVPLYFRLLSIGSLMVVDKPFFQHLTNGDSLSGSMSEGWFLDMSNADFELALSGGIDASLRSRLGVTRDALQRLVYFQAARVSYNKKAHLTQWLFLRRLDALGGAPLDLLVKAEVEFMHDFLIARLAQIIDDGCFGAVRFIPSDLADVLVPCLRKRLPELVFLALYDELPMDESTIVLVDSLSAELTTPAAFLLSLHDLFMQMRLSAFEAVLVAREGRLSVRYADPQTAALVDMPTYSFNKLRTRYSSDAEHGAAD
jgi:glycosyltransferase involved in cell wall biosynthesis